MSICQCKEWHTSNSSSAWLSLPWRSYTARLASHLLYSNWKHSFPCKCNAKLRPIVWKLMWKARHDNGVIFILDMMLCAIMTETIMRESMPPKKQIVVEIVKASVFLNYVWSFAFSARFFHIEVRTRPHTLQLHKNLLHLKVLTSLGYVSSERASKVM